MDKIAELADAYRESVERLLSAIETAAIRQMAEDDRRNRNASKSNRARGRARGASNVASV